MKIIVCKGKYGDWYYDASTPEQLERSARTILLQNLDAGYYSEPTAPEDHLSEIDRALVALTDDELDALPQAVGASLSGRRDALKSQLARSQRDYTQELEQWETIQKVVAEPDRPHFVKVPRGGKVALQSTAWNVLLNRSGYEYEGVELETVKQP